MWGIENKKIPVRPPRCTALFDCAKCVQLTCKFVLISFEVIRMQTIWAFVCWGITQTELGRAGHAGSFVARHILPVFMEVDG